MLWYNVYENILRKGQKIMKIIKRTLSAIVAATMAVALFAGCSKSEPETQEPEVTESTSYVPLAPYDQKVEIVDNSVDFAKNLKLGWNLGNTLDATGTGMESETSWGQPKTTKELIDYIKASGFTRTPVIS